ncbi:MAG: hypothetical protein HY723_06300, partial [Chloroflexi bacterium]|nr:hypothetical protein [Chloroflexota bacterium]
MAPEVRLAVFFLELPEALAIENGSTFTFQTEDTFPELEGVDSIHPTADLPPFRISRESAGNVVVSFRILQVDASQLTERPILETTDRAIERVLPKSVAKRRRSEIEAPRLYPHRTVIEAVTPVRGRDDNELNIAFDRCERYFWKVLDAYRIVAPRMAGRVTREVLPPIIPFITRDIGSMERWDDELSFFHL